MPKMKTKSSAKKRFKLTGTGKIKRKHAFKSHILTKKGTKQKRNSNKNRFGSRCQTHQTSNNNCVFNSQLEFIN